MSFDLEQLISEDVDVKNEMHNIFKQLEDGFQDILKNTEKFEGPYNKIIENLKDYARVTTTTGNQEDSPFFDVAKKYEGLLDGHKEYIHDVTDDVILVLQQLIGKSKLLDEAIKELSSAAKDARKLKNKLEKIDEDISNAQAQGKSDKATKKLAEKETKTAEFNSAKDKLASILERFNVKIDDFNSERDELMKKSLGDLIASEKKLIEAMQSVHDELDKAAGSL